MTMDQQIGPIARKVLKALRKLRRGKVIDLAARERGHWVAEALQRNAPTPADLARLDRGHALYVYVHNVMTTLVEELTCLEELERFADAIEAAEEEYMPSGPPMSPLTTSYFTSWCFFDLAMGIRKETLGTIILAIGQELQMDPAFLDILRLMQESRMGIYCNGPEIDGRAVIREVFTDRTIHCHVPTGTLGNTPKLWLLRVLPAPQRNLDAVVFTTPYVITRPDEKAWRSYFDRTLGKPRDPLAAYSDLMKHGPKRHYWNEYIFEAYWNHMPGAIFLAGLPDDPTTRPHSPHYIPPPGVIRVS
jgi:hypothetical protein